jgi:hypothetical protein
MITANNYYDKVSSIDLSKLQPALKKGHEYVNKVTQGGSDWNAYDSSPTIQKVIDEYFKKLSVELAEEKTESAIPEKGKKERVRKLKAEKQPRIRKQEGPIAMMVERIPEELRFMRRYANLNGKKKTKEQLLRFVNSLQKAILERRIRKDSIYAKQVVYMQDNLLKTYNSMGKAINIEISPKTFEEFKREVDGEKVLPSIQLIKRYVSLHGKVGTKEKAKKLFEQITKAVKKEKVSKTDRYAEKLNEIWLSLQSFLSDKNQKALPMNSAELNGLKGILSGCNCDLSGIEDDPEQKPKVMSSMDFAQMKFSTIGFTGKWHDLIGDPAPGFSAMVFGKPKMGKSYLSLEFAGYLASSFGKVLYVAREEGLDKTLQQKIQDLQLQHPNFSISETLPEDLSHYDFVFLDTVSKLSLSPFDLDMLRKTFSEKSFIFVFQTTKEGNFKGKNEFQHDVDVVIEVPEKGKAVQFGRYNQGGEMRFFKEE